MIEPCEEVKRVEQRYEKALDDMEKHYKDVLDKIRAEIEELDTYYDNDYFSGNNDAMYKCNEVLQIIDKYTK